MCWGGIGEIGSGVIEVHVLSYKVTGLLLDWTTLSSTSTYPTLTSQLLALDLNKLIDIRLNIPSHAMPDTASFHSSSLFAVSFSTKPPDENTNGENSPTHPG